MPRFLSLLFLGWLFALVSASSSPAPPATSQPAVPALFQLADSCVACHNSLLTPSGEDVSIGTAWRATMMANASRDPYWHAGVRRETLEHPEHAGEIEHECSVCHMPMAHTLARAAGRHGEVFAHLPVGIAVTPEAAFAADGVSCTTCHQITAERFGTRESFVGGFVIDTSRQDRRRIFGPFAVDAGRTTIMRSATGFEPAESAHVRQSEMCATCHVLYTKALGPGGQIVGELPEQVPYLEWRHSGYRDEKSCQACHMPAVTEPAPFSSVLGEPRTGWARHTFRGGNFFMLGILNRYAAELGVTAPSQELDAATRDTIAHLATETAVLSIERVHRAGDALELDVVVENLAGHKFPTAYPSRRAWIYLRVADAGGRVLFESGAVDERGAIRGNANDADASHYEPHYREIRREEEVQIYEPILADSQGHVTTGLLSAVRYAKDNRLLPRGFDKASAHADIAVYGEAASDPDFAAGRDRVRYVIPLTATAGPVSVEAELRFQPIAFRWADNLRAYDAPEPQRFTRYYSAMARTSWRTIARATAGSRSSSGE